MSLRPIATACVLAGITILLYGFRLAEAPLGADEAITLRASQLQDADSSRAGTPLFFRVTDERWLLPVPVYTTAIVRAAGGGDASARLATVMVAALDIALLSLCARLIFGSPGAGIAAAALLMIMPAHVAYARSGTDAIYPMPFVLAALLAMLAHTKSDRASLPIVAGTFLAAGVYTERAAPLTMTCVLVLACIALVVRRRFKPALLLSVGFGLLLLPAVVWFALHPQTYPDTFGRWAIHLAHVRNPLEGLRAFFNRSTLGNRVSLYWGFFNPTWLFFDRTGPFVLVMLPLAVAGLWGWRRVISRDAMLLIVGGVLVVPLAGSAFGEPRYAANALAWLPFAALLMTVGAVDVARRFRRQPARTYRSTDTRPGG